MTERTPTPRTGRAERVASIDETVEMTVDDPAVEEVAVDDAVVNDVDDAVVDDSHAAYDSDAAYDLDDLEVEDRTVQRVDSIDLRSLALVAGLFYLTAFLVLAGAVALVWIFAASTGFISQLEEFMQDIGFRDFRLAAPEVIFGFVILIVALVLFLTVMTLLAGAFYNMLGMGKSGIRIRTTILQRERRVVEPDEEEEPEPETLVTKPLVVEPPKAGDGNGDGERASVSDTETESGDT